MQALQDPGEMSKPKKNGAKSVLLVLLLVEAVMIW